MSMTLRRRCQRYLQLVIFTRNGCNKLKACCWRRLNRLGSFIRKKKKIQRWMEKGGQGLRFFLKKRFSFMAPVWISKKKKESKSCFCLPFSRNKFIQKNKNKNEHLELEREREIVRYDKNKSLESSFFLCGGPHNRSLIGDNKQSLNVTENHTLNKTKKRIANQFLRTRFFFFLSRSDFFFWCVR